MEHLEGILVPLGVFTMVVLLIWLGLRSRQVRAAARVEALQRLLEKFGSGQEFSEFLETDGSQKLLKKLWLDQAGQKQWALRAVYTGVILTIFGLGLGVLMVWEYDFVYPAILVSSLGIAFLVAAAVSLHLAKRWGLDQQD